MEGEKEMEGGRNERTKEGKSRKGRKERERGRNRGRRPQVTKGNVV